MTDDISAVAQLQENFVFGKMHTETVCCFFKGSCSHLWKTKKTGVILFRNLISSHFMWLLSYFNDFVG